MPRRPQTRAARIRIPIPTAMSFNLNSVNPLDFTAVLCERELQCPLTSVSPGMRGVAILFHDALSLAMPLTFAVAGQRGRCSSAAARAPTIGELFATARPEYGFLRCRSDGSPDTARRWSRRLLPPLGAAEGLAQAELVHGEVLEAELQRRRLRLHPKIPLGRIHEHRVGDN